MGQKGKIEDSLRDRSSGVLHPRIVADGGWQFGVVVMFVKPARYEPGGTNAECACVKPMVPSGATKTLCPPGTTSLCRPN